MRTLQLAPGFRVGVSVEQVAGSRSKAEASVPVMEMESITRGAVPLLVMVKSWGAEALLRFTREKSFDSGERTMLAKVVFQMPVCVPASRLLGPGPVKIRL